MAEWIDGILYENNIAIKAHKQPEVRIKEGTTAIAPNVFSYAGDCLRSAVLPDSLESSGCKAFSNCRQLTSARLPNNLRRIGHKAFNNCIRLKPAQLPDGLESAGNKVFHNCGIAEP